MLAVGTVFALTGIAISLAPPPSSQAAQGQKSATGVPYAGILTTKSGWCSVTVVSEWLAITARHCGDDIATLNLNVSASTPGQYRVNSVSANGDLDVEALFLRSRSGLPVTPLRAAIAQDRFSAWGYGLDHSNKATHHLTRADFNLPQVCPANINPVRGSLCWTTTATNSVCSGDSGGPVTQNGAIIGMVTGLDMTVTKPDGHPDCSTAFLGQALPIRQMQPWLDQMIKAADPAP